MTRHPSRADHLFEEQHHDLASRTVKGLKTRLTQQVVGAVIQLGAQFVVARLLFPADFGLVGMVTALTGALTVLQDLGLGAAIVQAKSIDRQVLSNCFWVNFSISCCMGLIVAGLAIPISLFYRETRLISLTLLVAVQFIIPGLQTTHSALLRRAMLQNRISVIELTGSVVASAATIALAFLGFGYRSLIVGPLISQIYVVVFVWMSTGWIPYVYDRSVKVGKLVRFGVGVTGNQLLGAFAMRLDNVMIGRMWGQAALGSYDKAYQLIFLPNSRLVSPLSTVLYPSLCSIVRSGDEARFKRVFGSMVSAVGYVTFAPTLAVSIGADWFIPTLLGPHWSACVPLFRAMTLFALWSAIDLTTHWLFLSHDKSKQFFIYGVFWAVTVIAAILIGVPRGPQAVAQALGVVTLFQFPFITYYLGKHTPFGIPQFARALAFPALAALASSAVALFIHAQLLNSVHPWVGCTILVASTLVITVSIAILDPAVRVLKDYLKLS
jgi:O-antigen/teichoic acid export membrane protein